MPSKRINIKCEVCCEVLNRCSHSAKRTISRNGFYICKKCSLIYRNKKNSRKLFDLRVHKGRGRKQIKTRDGWKDLHVFIVEKYLGRELDIGECVHHCDCNKLNNKLKNLELMTNGAHTILHHTGMKRSKKTIEKIREKAINRPSKTRSLTYEIAEKIRVEYSYGGLTYSKIANKYNTTKEIVAHIIKNRSYKNKEK